MAIVRSLAILAVVAALTGCATTSQSSGSRAEIYESLEQLAADSELVVVATATSQVQTSNEAQLLTGTRIVIEEALTPQGFTGNPSALDLSKPETVWQLGDSSAPGPLPFMKDGGRYLLFLVATGLDKPAGGYFITGSSAGFWAADGDSFTRPVDEGDSLPKTVTLDDLK